MGLVLGQCLGVGLGLGLGLNLGLGLGLGQDPRPRTQGAWCLGLVRDLGLELGL